MFTYVLVHGSWSGSWCWYKVAPLLEQQGHTVAIASLPGHGTDQTPIQDITLQSYTEAVTSVIDAQAEPVILVGHSMGGSVISQATEARPDKVKTVVYLSAYLLQNGQSVFQLAQTDGDSQLAPALTIDQAHGVAAVAEDTFLAGFFHDCSPSDLALGRALQRPDPLVPPSTPITITETNYGLVPRVYIETTLDRVVSPSLQKRMYTATPCQQVLSLEAGHCSFLSVPDKLVEHLLSLAQ